MHTGILRQRTIPPRLNSINIKSLLRQLSRILAKHGSSTSLEYRKPHDSPEHPGELKYLPKFKFLVLLCQGFFGANVLPALEVFVAVAVEEVKDEGG